MGEWKAYVWSPEKRGSYRIESRRYGMSLGAAPLGETKDHPGFFETDADFLFVPFSDSAPVNGPLGEDKKRIVRL